MREDDSADLKLLIQREGENSSFGRLELYSLSDNKRIGIANNISVFAELAQAHHFIRIPDYSKYSGLSQVRIKYIGEKEHAGTTFIDQVINLP
jgi:hypothetical protein